MLTIISPSKSQDFACNNISNYSQTRQIEYSKILIDILKQKTQNELASLMSISNNLAKLNLDRFKKFSTPFTLENSKQALFAFKGSVYNGINSASLSSDNLSFAQNNLRILSGLYGVLRPLDLIQPYRLEMGTKLKNNKGDNLYQFWGDEISKLLNNDEDKIIINLASNEYFKSINKKALKAKIINIAFKELKKDKYKVIGIYAKYARGLMANYIIKNKINAPKSLKNFNQEGYKFNEELTDKATWVFTRG
jgi:hypothetical protein